MSSADDTWFSRLQQASFRGVPFAVESPEGHYGRRNAVHEYPYRDKPWPEDLGRRTRTFEVTGFLISNSLVYGGGSAIDQEQQMIAAAETEGLGTFVHPTQGELQVECDELVTMPRAGSGDVIEIRFRLIEGGDKQYPSASTSTGDASDASADDMDAAAGDDFADDASDALPLGADVVDQALATANRFADVVTGLARDATSVLNLAAQLSGSFGRYFNGANAGGFDDGLVSTLPAGTTVEDLVVQATANRAMIDAASAELVATASQIGGSAAATQALAPAARVLVATLAGACANPADALRLLGRAAVFQPVAIASLAPVGAAVAEIDTASADLFRRTAIAAMARSAAAYQPSSYDDAAAVRTFVAGFIDAEIDVAGEAGADQSYSALRALRQAVATDLTTRGADLAPIKTFLIADSEPALVLAQRFYGDPGRADELVTHADPANPLFFPAAFKALAA